MRPDIILLNGPSSAGKSSIARELREQLRRDGIGASIVSLDDHLEMSATEPVWEDDVYAVAPEMVLAIARALSENAVVLVDHVITSARIFEALPRLPWDAGQRRPWSAAAPLR